jgi:hypothetical protein
MECVRREEEYGPNKVLSKGQYSLGVRAWFECQTMLNVAVFHNTA